ncbi:MAG: 2-amino-4-hydroxy-6-hydroxymethyldihydropteridine diphosphokinase [Agarilytica sp.]
MPKILLGIGSNINREENIRSGIETLSKVVSGMCVSPVYESPAFGFSGDNFFNLVVLGETDRFLSELVGLLREIEFTHGREKDATKFSSRYLDIDVLIYGEKVGLFEGLELPRPEILTQSYVLKPIVDIAPELVHPKEGKRFDTIWANFSGDKRQLWQSDFQYSGDVSAPQLSISP